MKRLSIFLTVFILYSCNKVNVTDFEFDNQGFMVIETLIENKQRNFIFDTCAEATVIAKDLVDLMGLTAHRSITINNVPVDIVYIPTLEINGIKLFQVEAAVVDMNNETFSDGRYDGILGLNVINLFVWDFDLKNSKLKVFEGQPMFKTDYLVLEYQKIEQTGLPFLKIDLGFFQSDAVYFDTGFTGFLAVNHLKDTTLLEFDKFTISQKFIFGSEDQKLAHYTAKDFKMFGKNFKNETLIYNVYPKREKDLLGNLFLHSFDRFIFNPIDSKILLSFENDETL